MSPRQTMKLGKQNYLVIRQRFWFVKIQSVNFQKRLNLQRNLHSIEPFGPMGFSLICADFCPLSFFLILHGFNQKLQNCLKNFFIENWIPFIVVF